MARRCDALGLACGLALFFRCGFAAPVTKGASSLGAHMHRAGDLFQAPPRRAKPTTRIIGSVANLTSY